MSKSFTVKPLEWVKRDIGNLRYNTAETEFGLYQVTSSIRDGTCIYSLLKQSRDGAKCKSVKNGKDLCQAHWRDTVMGLIEVFE